MLLFLPRLLSKKRTWKLALTLPLILLVVLVLMVLVVGLVLLVSLMMVGVGAIIVLSPLLLVAALIFGPEPIGHFLGVVVERGADWMEDVMDFTADQMDRVGYFLDSIMEWVEERD